MDKKFLTTSIRRTADGGVLGHSPDLSPVEVGGTPPFFPSLMLQATPMDNITPQSPSTPSETDRVIETGDEDNFFVQ